ncbi:MAG: hypothetical protein ACRD5L_11595, partial [Bryobacteraceae bacterium]
YVTEPRGAAPVSAPKVQPAPRPSGVMVSSPIPTPQPAPPASRSDAQWEMVIPKMARPTPQRTPTPTIAAARVPLVEIKPPESEPPADIVPVNERAVSFYTLQESFMPRRWKLLILAGLTILAIGLIAWVRPKASEPEADSSSAQPAAGAWSRRTAFLVGSKEPREIVVYDGSNGLENYRFEFGWTPEPSGVGWIFRAQDSANYYAAKVALLQAGITPAISLEHFTVANGVEGPHSRKVTTLSKATGSVLVRLDASGPAFTLYVDGNPVDYWNDSRFTSGSLGFYEDRGARPLVQTLRFTFQKKGGTQTVLASLD